jgi:hypothetical protein
MALNKPTTLQSICTSLETSRKLKEAGFPQEGGIAYWTKTKHKNWILLPYDVKREITIRTPGIVSFGEYEFYRAFTFNELWELLPKMIEKDLEMFWIDLYVSLQTPPINVIGYTYLDSNEKGCHIKILVTIRKEFLQEAAAELALWCRKEGHL